MSLLAKYRKFNPRLLVFYFIIGIMLAILLGGLARRQLLLTDLYSEREERQHLRRVLMPAPRGLILDRHGEILVGNQPRVSVVVHLNELRPEFRQEYIRVVRAYREMGLPTTRDTNLESLARVSVVQRYLDEINLILERDETVISSDLERHFRQDRLLPFILINDLTAGEYARLLEQVPIDSPLQLYSTSMRDYPFGSLAAHTLGYTSLASEISTEGVPGEGLTTFHVTGSQGRSGLELAFDDHLQGQSGGQIWIVDPSGFQHRMVEQRSPVPGANLRTTLDATMQRVAEEAFAGKRGAAVAMDVRTGEVLVLASLPSYDLNAFIPRLSQQQSQDIESRGAWLNRATQGIYPPGSTFKLISAMAALRPGLIDPETTSFCPGFHQVGNRRFPCHNRRGHGVLDLRNALRVSCNVYFYEHGLSAGVERIAAEAMRHRLHEPTGIELPYESRRMLIPTREWKRERFSEGWFPGDTANLSIGQGFVQLSPLQMAVFTASLAANRTFVRPTLVIDPPPRPLPLPEPIGLREGDREAILEGMEAAVLNGTARFAGLPDRSIGGKTGTAQVRRRGETLHMAWFVGVTPMDRPEIAVAVLVEGMEAQDGFAGGATAAPIAREIFRAYYEGQEGDDRLARAE